MYSTAMHARSGSESSTGSVGCRVFITATRKLRNIAKANGTFMTLISVLFIFKGKSLYNFESSVDRQLEL